MNRPELREGDVLTRRYLLQERIATGGMSVIWRAFDQSLQRMVAIKVLDGSLDDDNPGRELMRREARATARLIHPDAIEVYDYGETVTNGGRLASFVVMRLLEGRSLADRVIEGPLPWAEAVEIAAGLAKVLAAAHDRGIVHRDVTPENVLLADDGPKLLDFGIAAFIGEADDQLVADFGTPPYVAPERLKGTTADPAVDVYALGVLLFENMKISKVQAGNGNGDAIHLDNAKRVWLDHNDLSSDTSHGTDYYDGLLDITHGSDYVTVSWSKLHDHVKCSLVGHSDGNSSEDSGHLRVTYHHNAFQTCAQRNPRVRFGNPVHVFNNYYYKDPSYTDYSYGIASTCGAGVLVEGNYFENIADPTHTAEGSSPGGSIVARNNYFVNSGTPQTSGSVASIPYSYTVDNPSGVKANVLANAGTGKI